MKKNHYYLRRKKAVLDGTLDVDGLGTKTLKSLLANAVKEGDESFQAFLEPLVQQRWEEHVENRRRLNRERYHKVLKPFRDAHPGEIRPVNTKKKEYSERQLKVISGEIPYEKARTIDFSRIAAIARNRGDLVLAEKMEDLSRERYADAIAKNRENSRLRSAARRKEKDPTLEDVNGYRTHLTKWENSIVESRADPGDYDAEALANILAVAKRAGSEQTIRIMERLIEEVFHPESVYKVKTKEEALSIVQKNTMFPITLPKAPVR